MDVIRNSLYTTVTTRDFDDVNYIKQLIALDIGMELAFLTGISISFNSDTYKNDLLALNQELATFKKFFIQFNIPLEKIRIHQPGGYMYHWYGDIQMSGYIQLKIFFSYCSELGFSNYVIHAPYGSSDNDSNFELDDYREKLTNLAPGGTLEVEEILVSNTELQGNKALRFYSEKLFEQLMKNSKATMLLDVYESGGVEKSIELLKERSARGFIIKSIHLQKDKHKILDQSEFEQLLIYFDGNFINEGFVKDDSDFDAFIKTKSSNCIIPNNLKISVLKAYHEAIKRLK